MAVTPLAGGDEKNYPPTSQPTSEKHNFHYDMHTIMAMEGGNAEIIYTVTQFVPLSYVDGASRCRPLLPPSSPPLSGRVWSLGICSAPNGLTAACRRPNCTR